jgi:hypothetical protein
MSEHKCSCIFHVEFIQEHKCYCINQAWIMQEHKCSCINSTWIIQEHKCSRINSTLIMQEHKCSRINSTGNMQEHKCSCFPQGIRAKNFLLLHGMICAIRSGWMPCANDKIIAYNHRINFFSIDCLPNQLFSVFLHRKTKSVHIL